MMKSPEELRSFVQKKLRRGYPQGELINELLKEGYQADEIDRAIYQAGQTKGQRAVTGNNPIWFVITTGLGIVGLSIVLVKFFIYYHPLGYALMAIGAAGIFIKFLLPFLEKK